MTDDVRERALCVLNDHEHSSALAIHNAVIDLRRNSQIGDERIIRRFLDHEDPMVAAATLYLLFEVHNQQDVLRPLVEKLAGGDARDDIEMPLQSMAISLLARFGKQDTAAIARLVEVAENQDTADVPRKEAWLHLAELHDVEWSSEDSEEMMMYPDSDASERIRNRIREAMTRGS